MCLTLIHLKSTVLSKPSIGFRLTHRHESTVLSKPAIGFKLTHQPAPSPLQPGAGADRRHLWKRGIGDALVVGTEVQARPWLLKAPPVSKFDCENGDGAFNLNLVLFLSELAEATTLRQRVDHCQYLDPKRVITPIFDATHSAAACMAAVVRRCRLTSGRHQVDIRLTSG